MGVLGWSRLLAEEGWLPFMGKTSKQREETSFWMTPESLEESHPFLEDRLVEIPPGSELHVDGYCLCFYIHKVAYARHCQSVLKRKKLHASKWKAWQVRQMIPSFLPLDLLTQLTREFVSVLRDELDLKLIIYWDGEERYAPPIIVTSNATTAVTAEAPGGRPQSISEDSEESDEDEEELEEEETVIPASFKHETEVFRQSKRREEWSALQDYCVHGRIPSGITLQQWETEFPKNRLFISQIMHALSTLEVPMKFCNEEADSIMARAVTGKTDAYILGMDSDFCFFPEASYIPINTLTKDNGFLQAVVMRREGLAESLNIPESAMVELAILMGNDYISNNTSFDLPVRDPSSDTMEDMEESALPTAKQLQNRNPAIRIPAYLDLLRHQGEGFRVQSPVPAIQECLQFVRRLYNLQDMSSYYDMEEPTNSAIESSLMAAAIGMTKEIDADLKNVTIDPQKGDKSLQDAVVRYLQLILRHQEESGVVVRAKDGTPLPRVLTMSHIQAFQMLAPQRPPYADIDKEIQDLTWRPLWRDIPAVYWIERITNRIVQNILEQQHLDGKVVQEIASPGNAFDPYLYHAYLRIAREAHAPDVTLDEVGIPDLAPEINKTLEPPKLVLPVDEFEETILESVQRNRVTIIQGDTGCGKSSRIPVMLLNAPSPNPRQTQTKLFISQPRRIAAKALVERLRSVEPELKDQIALRMGHGVREYETNYSRAWFVTTGYLVRLLANHPERFDDISVLIIDEVHERSVDTDILCLLCRRLLLRNEHIRLVLMSATLAADMYREYFGVPEPPIRVGARRFPVKEVYLDDLKSEVRLSSRDARKANELLNECLSMRCKRPPSMQYMEKVYSVVANLAMVIGQPGTSVLIFVPGMNEIVAITELIESLAIPGIRFTCIPIHSDIPFEDQMLVFDASKDDEVKVVIATNAAESSLTLPEVDNVICLGLCKQIVYNEASHRQMLTPTWISRASATQRAGRTGRVRTGTVYRMYARQSYECDMDAFEPGEMLRIPLDSVILMLKEMLSEEEVSEVLLTCLEPPDISAIDRSFESLHKSHFITAPDDSCELTNLGSFVSSLGIDLALGSLIGLGIQMGVGAEAIQMAAILSFPKSPWVMSNPLVHETGSFNDNTCRSYVSRCHFDANLFSEPLAAMNLVWEYEQLSQNQIQRWGKFHNVFLPRIRRLSSTTVNLRKRVADFLGISENLLRVARPPAEMPHGMITLLRIIQVWVFHETMIQFDQKTLQSLQKKYIQTGLSFDIQPRSDMIEKSHLEQILMKDRHSFTLNGSSEIRQKGDFEYIPVGASSSGNFINRLETHVISYSTEKQFGAVCVCFHDSLLIYTLDISETENAVANCLEAHRKEDSRMLVRALSNEGKSTRGIGERACGMWTVEPSSKKAKGDVESVTWTRYCFELSNQQPSKTASAKKQKKKLDAARNELKSITNSLEKMGRTGDHKCILLHFPWGKETINPNERFRFSFVSFGTTSPVNPIDMKDILGPNFTSSTKQIAGKQKVQFALCDSTPREFKKGNDEALANDTCWNRPLITCIPEGARVLSVLVSNRRRDNVIKLVAEDEKEYDEYDEYTDGFDEDEDNDLCVYFDKSTNASFRWKRFNTSDSVYIDANSVPATAVPLESPDHLYCVCANTLEVRGGGLRAEGLSLLPQGKAFLLLARFSFGLFEQANVEDGTILEMALMWIGVQLGRTPLDGLLERIERAVDFHQSALDLGESLECFPDKVAELLEVFDGVDGFEATVWDSLSSNPLIRHNMGRHQREHREHQQRKSLYRRNSTMSERKGFVSETEEDRDDDDVTEDAPLLPLRADANQTDSGGDNSDDEAESVPKDFSVVLLSKTVQSELGKIFQGEPDKYNVGSCEILANVVNAHRSAKSGQEAEMRMDGPDWEIYSIQAKDGSCWFKAVFKPKDIGYAERGIKFSAWMKKKKHWTARPRTVSTAWACAPPQAQGLHKESIMIAPKTLHLVFDDLKLAVQMEAAFWLERQFATKKLRWYELPVGVAHMVGQLKQTCKNGQRQKPSGKQKKQIKKERKKRASKKKQEKNAAAKKKAAAAAQT